MKTTLRLLATFTLAATSVGAQSLERAELFREHGLADDAKRELVLIVTSSADDGIKAHAYYLLGAIAFDQDRIPAALSSWRTLTSRFPESKEAKEVAGKMVDLAQIAGERQKESRGNAIAQAYIRNGGYWSSGKQQIFTIDTSWMTNVDVAVNWYDRAIAEFPKTTAARVAYEEKFRCLLGWKAPGQYGEEHGLWADFAKYMPLLLATLDAFERDFPDAATLQAFR